MSYARSIVAMSRGALPAVGEQRLREEHAEVASAEPPAEGPKAPIAPPAAAEPRATPSRDEPVLAAEQPEAPRPREVIVERERSMPMPIVTEHATTVVTTHTIEREKVVIPQLPDWLAEDRTAADPLVESADTDELRTLLRSVRQWTSSDPEIIASEPASSTEADVTAAAPEPVQVSIGNVVITVEDAPVAATHATPRSAAPHRTTSDRLARNHIRRP